MRRLTLSVSHMTCASCVGVVERGILKMQGVKAVDVSLPLAQADVLYDEMLAGVEDMVNCVSSLGYDADILREEGGEEADPVVVVGEPETTTEVVAHALLSIAGMTCASCQQSVERGLSRLNGVKSVSASLPLGQAEIEYDALSVGPREFLPVLESLGYEAEVVPLNEGSLAGEDAETRAQALHKAERSSVLWRLSFSLLLSLPLLIISMGFGGHSAFNFKGKSSDEGMDMTASGRLSTEIVSGLDVNSVVQFVLATPVQFGPPGMAFARGSWKEMRNRSLGMNTLVFAGTISAYLYSIIMITLGLADGTAKSDNLFFETSAILITFILLGKYLELLARARASSAVSKLMKLKADSALLVESWPETQKERIVPSDVLQPGDVIKIIRGAKVPADASVLRGSSFMNEAMISGESMPVEKGPGKELIAATVCEEGVVYARVTHVGADTTLSRIIRLIQKAQASKPPIQQVGDQITSYFVPTVMLISLTTFVIWLALAASGVVPKEWVHGAPGNPGPALFSFMFALSVLVIACPCAVGLAAPMSIVVGSGMAARNGILSKGGDAFQAAASVNAVIFDKTGTITVGKPRVLEFLILSSRRFSSLTPRTILCLVASAERASEHPLGRAIVEYAQDSGLESDFEEPEEGSFLATAGKGLECVVSSRVVTVGSPKFVMELLGEGAESKPLPESVQSVTTLMEERGRTAVCVAVDGSVVAIIGIADAIKPEAPRVMQTLMKQGIQVWMLTGDNRRTALAVAEQCSIPLSQCMYEVLPSDKAGHVADLQQRGMKVAMVGDGINDSPALTQADVGIAIGAGTDVAIESADMVLMRSHLYDIITALSVSRSILRRIKLNYLWAFGYNTCGIPIAAGVLFPVTRAMLPPSIAGASMALSSVSVVLSSLILLLYKKPRAVAQMEKAAMVETAGNLVAAVDTDAISHTSVNVITIDLDCSCKCFLNSDGQSLWGETLEEVEVSMRTPLLPEEGIELEEGDPACEACPRCEASHLGSRVLAACTCKCSWCACRRLGVAKRPAAA